jgi:DNA-binding beta-propeller fold protein YncE
MEMRRTALLALLSLGCCAYSQAHSSDPLQLRKTATLPAVTGKFDHFAFDAAGQRLFIAATGNHSVEVLNVDSGKIVERITGLGKPHGLAWVADEQKLFVADGTLADLRIYSGSPFKLLADIPLSDDADDMVYDESTRLLYVGHGGGSAAIPGRVAVVDTRNDTVVTNLPASAHPEALDIDPQGKRVFANIADSAEVLVIDAATHSIAQTWKISRAKDNVPVAYDADDHALLIGCRTPGTAVSLDASNGSEVNSQPSASGADDLFYESSTRRAYLISGSGTVDVYQVSRDKTLKTVAAVQTEPGAKTGLLVPSLHTLFVGIPSAAGKPAEIRMYSTAAMN